MKAVDLFAGCDGLSLGFQNQGFEIVSTFEWWDSAVKCYQANFSQPLSSGLYKVLYPVLWNIIMFYATNEEIERFAAEYYEPNNVKMKVINKRFT